MVVTVEGQTTQQRANCPRLIWAGPVTLSALFILANLYAMSLGDLTVGAFQFAAIESAGLLVVFLPFLRLVREVNVGPYGIEAHFCRGSARYLRWSDIDSVTVKRHSFIPSRIRLEDVYGRRLYLKGEPASLAPVLRALRQRNLRP